MLAEAVRHLSAESPRAILDLSLRLHWIRPERDGAHLMVIGAEGGSASARPADLAATARHHGVEATLLPGMAHMLMLEPDWEIAARAIAGWLAAL